MTYYLVQTANGIIIVPLNEMQHSDPNSVLFSGTKDECEKEKKRLYEDEESDDSEYLYDDWD